MKKAFHISDIISVYTGNVLSINSTPPLAGLMGLATFIADSPLHSFQVGMYAEKFRSHLEKSYPWLADINIPSEISDQSNSQEQVISAIDKFITEQAKLHGEYLEVEDSPNLITTNPLEDLIILRGGTHGIIPIILDNDDNRDLSGSLSSDSDSE
jgi:hypothetical protein